jgi:hypothetical protein
MFSMRQTSSVFFSLDSKDVQYTSPVAKYRVIVREMSRSWTGAVTENFLRAGAEATQISTAHCML